MLVVEASIGRCQKWLSRALALPQAPASAPSTLMCQKERLSQRSRGSKPPKTLSPGSRSSSFHDGELATVLHFFYLFLRKRRCCIALQMDIFFLFWIRHCRWISRANSFKAPLIDALLAPVAMQTKSYGYAIFCF